MKRKRSTPSSSPHLVLDSFPHIRDAIIGYADKDTQRALFNTCQSTRNAIASRLFTHLEAYIKPDFKTHDLRVQLTRDLYDAYPIYGRESRLDVAAKQKRLDEASKRADMSVVIVFSSINGDEREPVLGLGWSLACSAPSAVTLQLLRRHCRLLCVSYVPDSKVWSTFLTAITRAEPRGRPTVQVCYTSPGSCGFDVRVTKYFPPPHVDTYVAKVFWEPERWLSDAPDRIQGQSDTPSRALRDGDSWRVSTLKDMVFLFTAKPFRTQLSRRIQRDPAAIASSTAVDYHHTPNLKLQWLLYDSLIHLIRSGATKETFVGIDEVAYLVLHPAEAPRVWQRQDWTHTTHKERVRLNSDLAALFRSKLGRRVRFLTHEQYCLSVQSEPYQHLSAYFHPDWPSSIRDEEFLVNQKVRSDDFW